MPGKEVVEPNAHVGQITVLEYANINGQEVLFSAGFDGIVKAWDVTNASNPAFNKLNKILEKTFGMPVLSMKLANPTLLVLGLNNGTF
jgi:hypothetical protein